MVINRALDLKQVSTGASLERLCPKEQEPINKQAGLSLITVNHMAVNAHYSTYIYITT
jgi:hypothetical protein